MCYLKKHLKNLQMTHQLREAVPHPPAEPVVKEEDKSEEPPSQSEEPVVAKLEIQIEQPKKDNTSYVGECPFKPNHSKIEAHYDRKRGKVANHQEGGRSGDLPAIEDFNCPLLVKRKRENSSEISAFNRVSKKQRVGYDEGNSSTLAKDTLFGPIANRNAIFNFAIDTNKEQTLKRSQLSTCEQSSCIRTESDCGKLFKPRPFLASRTEAGMVQKLITNQGKFLEQVHSETKQGIYCLYSMVLRSNHFMKEMLDKQNQMEIEMIKLRESNELLKQEYNQLTGRKWQSNKLEEKQSPRCKTLGSTW